MLFAISPRAEDLRRRVAAFMEAHVYPAEAVFENSSTRCRAGGAFLPSWKS